MSGIRIESLGPGNLPLLDRLFAAHGMTTSCWCMWFIIPVKAYHEAGTGNRDSFVSLMQASTEPMGYLAIEDGEAIGWCAAGPCQRYVRGIRTPSYRSPDNEGDGIWLVPCFFIPPQQRGKNLSRKLLAAAVAGARQHGATAIDGFPFTDDKRRSGGETQVGFAATFRTAGFRVIRNPSPSRVVMRLNL